MKEKVGKVAKGIGIIAVAVGTVMYKIFVVGVFASGLMMAFNDLCGNKQ